MAGKGLQLSSKDSPKLSYRRDVDGLRAIAVGSVLIFHLFPKLLPGGFVGVDIFFVISGFLITGIILDHLKKGDFSFWDFYSRRVKRIFPALLIVLATTAFLGWLCLLPNELDQLGKHLVGGIGFASNIFLWREAGYFDAAAETKPLLHLWSLGIEEQFYFFWPLLLFFIYRLNKSIFKVTLILILISFGANVALISQKSVFVFFFPLFRGWELLAGALLAVVHKKSEKTNHLFSILGFGFIVAALLLIDKNKAFPGWWALLPVLGSFFIIAAGPNGVFNRTVLATPAFVGIGLISYPLYLWHWPFISLSKILNIEESLPWGISILFLSLGLSALTYFYVERRARQQPSRFAFHLLGLGIVTLVFGNLFWNGKIKSRFSQRSEIQAITQATLDWRFPSTYKKIQIDGVTVFVKGSAATSTFYLGDSNIQQYSPRIEKLVDADTSKAAIFYFEQGCPPLPRLKKDQYPHCDDFMNRALKIGRLANVDTIVVAAAWYFHMNNERTYFDDVSQKKYIAKNTANQKLAFASLETFVRDLRALGKKVFLVLNIPIGPEFDPRRILDRGLTKIALKARPGAILSDIETKYQDISLNLKKIAANTGAQIIDPVPFLCSSNFCPAKDEGKPRYKDSGHLTASFVEKNVTYLDETLFAPRKPLLKQ